MPPEMTDQEEYDAEQAELIAAASGKAAPSAAAKADATAEAVSSEEAAATAALEAEAIRKGWKPQDKYEGEAGKWVDAKTFIARGERFNKNLQKEVEQMKAKLASFEGTRAQFVKFHEETIKRKDTELADALKQLRIQRSEAQFDGEHAAVVEIEDRIQSVTKEREKLAEIPKEEPAAAAADYVDPVMEEWIADGNEWFKTDAKLRAYAITIGQDLIKDGETLRGRKLLDKVSGLMAEEFPRKFKGVQAERGAAVESSVRSAAAAVTGKTERDLPKADRELMNQFIKEGWTTKEKFLAEYRW